MTDRPAVQATIELLVRRYTLPLPGWNVRIVDGWRTTTVQPRNPIPASIRAGPADAPLPPLDLVQTVVQPEVGMRVDVVVGVGGLERWRVGLGWSLGARTWFVFREHEFTRWASGTGSASG